MPKFLILSLLILVCFRIDAGIGSTSCIEAPFKDRAKWRGVCFGREAIDKKKRTVDCQREYKERFC